MMKPLKTLGATLGALGRDRRGNVAMIGAICALPLVMMLGIAVDLGRQNSARQYAQDSIDQSALAAAVSRAKTQTALYAIVEDYLAANLDTRYFRDGYTFDVTYDAQKRIGVRLRSNVRAHFAGVLGKSLMPVDVNVMAVRGSAEAVELALVLDNTGSMEKVDGGVSRMSALKTAATELVNALKENEDADVKIGVVPYGEYVNIGESHRGSAWLVTDEKDVPVAAGEATYPATQCIYEKQTVPYTYNGDGYSETRYREENKCVGSKPHPKAGEKYKTGGGTTQHRFRGCVYSRPGSHRLTDQNPTNPKYYGMIETDKNPDCMTEVTPLTATKSTVLNALNAMRTRVNGNEPQTYVPTGVLWGINVLSPDEPYTQGRAYAAGNRAPRKIMVVMTDGENTMRFVEESKKRYGTHAKNPSAAQISQTNADVTALCDYAKSMQIEVYTVSLGVSNAAAQTMMRGCATKSEFYFNASDNAALGDAFREIAASINRVRLIR